MNAERDISKNQWRSTRGVDYDDSIVFLENEWPYQLAKRYVLDKIFHIVKTMHSLFFPFSCFEMLDMSLYGREMNMCSQGDLDKMGRPAEGLEMLILQHRR